MAEVKRITEPRPGFLAFVGRATASRISKLGWRTSHETNIGQPDVTARGYYRDEVSPYTHAPLATRKVWELHRARYESRQLYLTAPPMNAFVHWAETNVIGDDKSRLDFLGMGVMDRKRLGEVLAYIRREWGYYQNEEIGGSGENVRDLGRKVLRDMLIDGDCFVIPFLEGGMRKYQAFPGDALSEQHSSVTRSGAQRQLGVEIDRRGKVLAYHFGWNAEFRPLHFIASTSELNSIRVPAEQVMHIRARVEGTQDIRSYPWCISVIDDLARTTSFYESFSRSAVRRAAVGIALEKNAEETFVGDTGTGDLSAAEIAAGGEQITEEILDTSQRSDYRDLEPYQVARSEAGSNFVLDEGYKAVNISTGAPSPQEGMILKELERRICAGLRVSPMSLLGDYSAVSFSAGQLAMVQERNTVGMLQSSLTENLYGPIYRSWFLRMWPEVLSRFPGAVSRSDQRMLSQPKIRLRKYPVLEKHRQVAGLLALFEAGGMTLEELRDELGLATGDMEGMIEQALSDRERISPPAPPAPPGFASGKAPGYVPEEEEDSEEAEEEE